MGRKRAFFTFSFLILLVLISLLASPALSKVSVNKSAPQVIDVGAKGLVLVEIEANASISSLDIVESMPLPATIEEWSVSGYDDSMVAFEARQDGDGTKYRWTFRQGFSPGEKATISYFFTYPKEGEVNLSTIYIYPSGFERIVSTVKVSEARSLVFVFVLGALVLLFALYLRQKGKKGEKKLFAFFGRLTKKKKQMD